MRTRNGLRTVIAAAALVGAGVGLWTQPAKAQSKGQVILTQKPAPEKATATALKRFLKKNRVSVVGKAEGGDSWEVHVFAQLRSKPAAKVLSLAHNGGKLTLAFFHKVKRRWVQAAATQIDYTAGSRGLRFPFKITQEHGLKPGVQYHLRIGTLDAKKRLTTLAGTYFKLK